MSLAESWGNAWGKRKPASEAKTLGKVIYGYL